MKHQTVPLALLALIASLVTSLAAVSPYQLTKLRVLARPGHEAKLEGARITGSNEGATTDFETLARLTAPAPGQWAETYTTPIPIEKSGLLYARATKPGLGDSPLVIAAYRVGTESAAKAITTFHIGNSLTDTIVGWLEPLAASAGRPMNFHRFTIPGAPTDWLWNHPGSGFGDSRYAEAFVAFGPIQHLTTQPFGGHNRSIENEAEYSGRFFDLCRKHNPQVIHWLYCQWPNVQFQKDTWAKAEARHDMAGGRFQSSRLH